jgi:hypothetical protein
MKRKRSWRYVVFYFFLKNTGETGNGLLTDVISSEPLGSGKSILGTNEVILKRNPNLDKVVITNWICTREGQR